MKNKVKRTDCPYRRRQTFTRQEDGKRVRLQTCLFGDNWVIFCERGGLCAKSLYESELQERTRANMETMTR